MIALDTETTGLNFWRHDIFGASWAEEENDIFLDWDNHTKTLFRLLLSSNDDIVFQNAKFDLHMLKKHNMPIPKKLHDTYIMSFLLNENGSHKLEKLAFKYLGVEDWKKPIKDYIKKHKCSYQDVPKDKMTEYASKDARVTFDLGKVLLPKIKAEGLDNLYDAEIELTKALIEIEDHGVVINTKLLSTMQPKLVSEEEKYLSKIYNEAGTKFDVLSEKQLGEVLFEYLKLPVQSYSPRSKLPKVDDYTLEKLNHPIIPLIQQYRTTQKMRSTYCDNITGFLDGNILHTDLVQLGPVTGRMACHHPNLQNVPREHSIRELFIPREDYFWFFFDYSQQEMRLYAGYANDAIMKNMYEKGLDVYLEMAKIFFNNKSLTKKSKERNFMKILSLAILYGIGITGISRKFNMSYLKAKQIRQHFRDSFPKMNKFLYYIQDKIKADGYIQNPFGRRRRLDSDVAYKGMNSLIQGSGGDIIKTSIVKVHKFLKGAKSHVLLPVHDELIVGVHKSELYIVPEIKEIMEDFSQIPIDLPVEIEYSNTHWGDKKPWDSKI